MQSAREHLPTATILSHSYQLTSVSQQCQSLSATSGQTKVYGSVDPVFAYTSLPTGTLPNGASVSFLGALDRAPGENVGSYAIGQGTLANSNYTISFVTADFTITPMPITVTADA